MADAFDMPELKEVLGAMIFAAGRPLSVRELRECLREVADQEGDVALAFRDAKDANVLQAIEELRLELARSGFNVAEVAGGFRLQSDPRCGHWLKHLLDRGKGNRLSRPGLETLAIIAYRQPVSRGEIENIRGVNVDHVIKVLLEMQLVKIAGRSELPGRPFLYGTTQTFLEHFGLKDLGDLDRMGTDALLRERERGAADRLEAMEGAEAAPDEPPEPGESESRTDDEESGEAGHEP